MVNQRADTCPHCGYFFGISSLNICINCKEYMDYWQPVEIVEDNEGNRRLERGLLEHWPVKDKVRCQLEFIWPW